jgi:DNA-binding NarL/FixJ family response regulator
MIDPGNGPVAAPQGHPLSPRETQVLEMASSGLTNAQIAAELFLAERTVHKHLENAFRKLDVHSRTDAVRTLLR